MQPVGEQPEGIDAVREFVSRTLCSKDNLEVGAFALSETPLEKETRLCGVYFCLHGPRQLRLTAIWELESNTILFYGSRGERFLTTNWQGEDLAAANHPLSLGV